jgi:4'-phosphopantetheinyl transferase
VTTAGVGEHLGYVATEDARADVWFAWVGDHVRDVDRYSRDYLSDDESARVREYRSREAAERYVVTRSLVRLVLSDRLDVPARTLQVSRTDTGKPVVTEGLHFNVSHSGDLILVALSEERAVGVDVERKREVERVPALVTRWLNEPEQLAYERWRAAGASDSEAFLRIWSLKEARLKALGVGISGMSAAQFDVVEARPLDGLLDSLAGPHVGNGYVGAVAFA